MKTLLIVTGVIGLAVLGFLLLSEPTENSSVQGSNSELTINKINTDVANGASFIDVRTVEEFNDTRIEGSENFTLGDLQRGKLPNVEKDTKIYLYCRSGNRSAEATKILEKAGFSNVVDLGGLEDVVAIGGVKVN
jgi:rhodanese-related sulfurtransferase